MNWLEDHVSGYYDWLKSKTHIPQNGGDAGVISTPFVGLFNDTLEIYASRRNGKIVLSDDGRTLHDLELAGVSFARAGARQKLLSQVLVNYGVQENGGELSVQSDEANFPQRKHDLIQAMLELGDFYSLAKHTVSSVFKEDVRAYLDEHEIVYTPGFISRGAIGIEFVFDFQIAYRAQEIVLKCFNGISKTSLASFLYMWGDIVGARRALTGKDVSALAIINDEVKSVNDDWFDALSRGGADGIRWSQRHQPEQVAKLKAA